MNSVSTDIASLLVADEDLGLTLGTNLFVAKELTKPNNIVTIFEGISSPPQLTFNKGENYFYDAVQIRVRNTEYRTGYALSYAIMVLLHGRGQETINDTLYSVIYCSSGPALLGWDDNERCLFVINFEVQRR